MLSGMNLDKASKLVGTLVVLIALGACGGNRSEASLPQDVGPVATVTSTVPEPPTTTTTTVPETTTTTTPARTPATTRTAAPERMRPATATATEPVAPQTTTTTTSTTTTTVVVPEPVTSHGGPVRDHVSFVDNLRARGLTVTPVDSVVQPFLTGDGTVLAVSGAGIRPTQLQSFQYESAQAAAADAATITPECNPRHSVVSWLGPPHFYRAGRVLVIYVGSDPAVTGLLTDLLGPQFCGT